MKIPRIYQDKILSLNDYIELDENTSYRLKTVLRIEQGTQLILFNGDGYEYLSTITNIQHKKVGLKIVEKSLKDFSSPLKIHLGQVISKGEKMDFVIQKATELGVAVITPLFSERSVVHLKNERIDKKREHWNKIAIHAAEQCGRTKLPSIEKPHKIEEWILSRQETTLLVLDPNTLQGLQQTPLSNNIALLIGPEGGLTEMEIGFATSRQFKGIKLGPRILRTETATLAAITALQLLAGDLS